MVILGNYDTATITAKNLWVLTSLQFDLVLYITGISIVLNKHNNTAAVTCRIFGRHPDKSRQIPTT